MAKIVIITDIHLCSNPIVGQEQRKLGHLASQLLEKFVQTMNSHANPDVVIQLGDLIQDFDPRTDRKAFSKALTSLSKLEAPLINVIGNHDQINIPEDELHSLLGVNRLYRYYDVANYRIIVLFARLEYLQALRSKIDHEQIEWLRRIASQSEKRLIVCSHYPLADQNLSENFWFSSNQEGAITENGNEVLDSLQTSKVACFINGHLHWNRVIKKNGIPHLSIQSFVENFDSNGIPAGTFLSLNASNDSVSWTLEGNDITWRE